MLQLLRQDVLLAIRLLDFEKQWSFQTMGASIGISASQCHLSYGRLLKAHLVDESTRMPIRGNLLELLVHGIKYFFPVEPGPIVKGIPTASSSPVWDPPVITPTELKFVWKHPKGRTKGAEIEPLYKSVPKIVSFDSNDLLYEVLTVLDSIRIGKGREKGEAAKILERLIHERL